MNRGVLLGLSAYVLWGLSPIYWKLVEDVPAGDVVTFRVLATALLLGLIHLVRRTVRPVLVTWSNPGTRRVVAGSALLISANWLIFVWAVNDGRILEASLGYFINPLVSVVLGVAVLGERLRPVQQLSIAIAVVGVVVLTIDLGGLPWVSLALAGTFGLYGLLRKTAAVGSLDGLTLELWLMLPIALGIIAWRAGTGDGVVGISVPARDLWLLGTGVLTAVPLVLFASAARQIALSQIGILQYVAPTLQFLLGVAIYDETWTQGQIAGYVTIWLALLIFALESFHTARSSSAQPTSAAANARAAT